VNLIILTLFESTTFLVIFTST